MRRKVLKKTEKRYDCDFYHKGCDIPYKTTRNVPWKAVVRLGREYSAVGDKVVPTYSHTEVFEYEV